MAVLGHCHMGYVQRIQGGAGGYFGSCMTCGSDPFPNRQTPEEVEADLRMHAVEIHDLYGDRQVADNNARVNGPHGYRRGRFCPITPGIM